jgi:hypothetical protein
MTQDLTGNLTTSKCITPCLKVVGGGTSRDGNNKTVAGPFATEDGAEHWLKRWKARAPRVDTMAPKGCTVSAHWAPEVGPARPAAPSFTGRLIRTGAGPWSEPPPPPPEPRVPPGAFDNIKSSTWEAAPAGCRHPKEEAMGTYTVL